MTRKVLTIAAAALVLCSCGAVRHQTQTSYIRDTCYVSRVQVDSVYRRDSVFVREKGDTVYKFVERWRDRYRIVRDTVYRGRVDSVAVERVREVKVEKPLTAWQKFRMDAFWILFAAAAGLAAWTFRKPLAALFLRL